MKSFSKYIFLSLFSFLLMMTTCKKEDEDPNKPEYGILELETYDATDIQGSSAVLHGELVSMSTPNLKEFGFIIDTTGTGGKAEFRRVSLGNYLKKPSAFQTTVSSLPKGPNYYFKAFAVDDDNIEANGSEKSFTLAEYTINSFFPFSGSMCDTIYLRGAYFGGAAANPVVTFEEIPATIIWAGQDTLIVQVPMPDVSSHKLSSIHVNINGIIKEYNNKFEYDQWYLLPHSVPNITEDRSVVVNNIAYVIKMFDFANFDESTLSWQEPWYIVFGMQTKYYQTYNNKLYALVAENVRDVDDFYVYDLGLKSYESLNYFSDSVYCVMINNYIFNRSVNQMFSLNHFIYHGFVTYIDKNPYPNVVSYTNELWKYDIDLNSWNKMNDLPDTGLIFTVNNQAYLLNNEHMYQYNSATDIWNDLNIANLPQINDPTYLRQWNYSYNNSNYFFNWQSQEIWKFDPSSNTWSFIENTPVAMTNPMMFMKDNMFYAEELSYGFAWLYFILE